MATDLERLVVQLSADVKSYENAMRRMVGVTNSQAKAIENRYKKMGSVLNNSLTAPLAGLGAAFSAREVIQYADAWTVAGNKIAAAAESAGVQTRSLSDLRKGADEAWTSFDAYVDLYAKLIRSASGVAKSEEEIATATTLVSKAMAASGAAVSEQQAAITQLGQAMGSGVLQGDELRSLRENAPVLAQAIADEFKVTIGGLKKLGEEGKLTSDRVFQAILGAQSKIEAQFAKTNASISGGFTRVRNALVEYIGTSSDAYGVTAAITGILSALAGNIEGVANTAAAAAVVLLSRYVPALLRAGAAQAVIIATNPFLLIATAAAGAAFAMATFGDSIQPIQGDLATLGDYGSAAWDAIISGAGTAAGVLSEGFLGSINLIAEAMGGVSVAWADVGAFIKQSVNELVGIFVAQYEVIRVTFEKLPAAVAAGAIGAMNAVIVAVENMINKVISGVNLAVSAINNLPGVDIGLVGGIDLPDITNAYAGAGAAAGAAYSGAIKGALAKDYLGEALKPLTDAANLNAFKRKISAAIGADPISTAGFGGGSGVPADGGGGGGGGGKGKRRRKDEYEREVQQILKRTAALQAETLAQAGVNPLIEDYEFAVSKARAAQDLLTAAQEAGIAITPEMRAGIDALAESYAQAVVASNQLQESQDQIRNQAEEMRQLSENTTGGLIKDLLEGKSAADAFADALDKVGDKLIDIALESAFDSKGGGFGGIFSAISGLFGRRALGGPVTAGRPYIVGEKRPELFVPNQNGVIIPSVPKASGIAAGGSSRIEIVLSQDLQARILSEAAGQSVRIAQSSSAQVRRDVPALVARSQLRD